MSRTAIEPQIAIPYNIVWCVIKVHKKKMELFAEQGYLFITPTGFTGFSGCPDANGQHRTTTWA